MNLFTGAKLHIGNNFSLVGFRVRHTACMSPTGEIYVWVDTDGRSRITTTVPGVKEYLTVTWDNDIVDYCQANINGNDCEFDGRCSRAEIEHIVTKYLLEWMDPDWGEV
jgi:hypothetical protein